jgi:itaconate CoA-transferase
MASDGEYVSLAVATAQDWDVFCTQVIERTDLLEDARFNTPEGRRQNRGVLEELIEGIFLERPHEEWLRRLKESRLPYGEVRGIAQVLAHPQVIARKMVREMESPVGTVPVVGSALRLSDSPARYDRIPGLGQDTEPILRELGYGDADIENLRRDKVI